MRLRSSGSRARASVDELSIMMNQVKAWCPDAALSLHSNTGVGRLVYPLIRRISDLYWARAIALNLARRMGWKTRWPTVRSLMFFSRLRAYPKVKMVLLEIGAHSYAKDAAFNRKYGAFEGKMAARAFLQGCGYKLLYDGPVQGPVPPGQERWLA
jgi:hypothetical protein